MYNLAISSQKFCLHQPPGHPKIPRTLQHHIEAHLTTHPHDAQIQRLAAWWCHGCHENVSNDLRGPCFLGWLTLTQVMGM